MQFTVFVHEIPRGNTYLKASAPTAVRSNKLSYTFHARSAHQAKKRAKAHLSDIRDIRAINVGPDNTIIVYLFPDRRQ